MANDKIHNLFRAAALDGSNESPYIDITSPSRRTIPILLWPLITVIPLLFCMSLPLETTYRTKGVIYWRPVLVSAFRSTENVKIDFLVKSGSHISKNDKIAIAFPRQSQTTTSNNEGSRGPTSSPSSSIEIRSPVAGYVIELMSLSEDKAGVDSVYVLIHPDDRQLGLRFDLPADLTVNVDDRVIVHITAPSFGWDFEQPLKVIDAPPMETTSTSHQFVISIDPSLLPFIIRETEISATDVFISLRGKTISIFEKFILDM